jgi:hypothetical protein
LPLSPIQEDAYSEDEEEGDSPEKQNGRAHVHFSLSPQDDQENFVPHTPPAPILKQPPKASLYRSQRHPSNKYSQNRYQHRLQDTQNHAQNNRDWKQHDYFEQDGYLLPHNHNHVTDDHDDDLEMSPVLLQYVQEKTEAMVKEKEEEKRLKDEKHRTHVTVEIGEGQPKDYLWLAVLSCVCCCPLGTLAVWYSRNVSIESLYMVYFVQ